MDYSKIPKYNAYAYRKIISQYIFKKYYTIYIAKKEKYADCEKLPPKYTFNNKFIIII